MAPALAGLSRGAWRKPAARQVREQLWLWQVPQASLPGEQSEGCPGRGCFCASGQSPPSLLHPSRSISLCNSPRTRVGSKDGPQGAARAGRSRRSNLRKLSASVPGRVSPKSTRLWGTVHCSTPPTLEVPAVLSSGPFSISGPVACSFLDRGLCPHAFSAP